MKLKENENLTIHSNARKNFQTLKIIHSQVEIAHQNRQAHESIEKNSPKKSKAFTFDAHLYELKMTESCLVDVAILWSFVTVESLLNYAIAKLSIEKLPTSGGMVEKLNLLEEGAGKLTGMVKELSFFRNAIVHDKPFGLIYDDAEEINVKYFSKYGIDGQRKFLYYDDLIGIYKKCEMIEGFICAKLVNKMETNLDDNSFFRLYR